MSNVIFAFNAISPVFIMVALGFFLNKKKVIDRQFMDKTSEIVFKYLFPFVMFRQIYKTDITTNFNPVFVGYAVIVALLIAIILWLIVPIFIKDRRKCGAFIQGIYRSNCVLMGVSLSINVFGDVGSLPTIMLLPFAAITYNVMSVTILTAFSPDNKKVTLGTVLPAILRNPIVIGAAAGVLVSLSGISAPPFLADVIDDLAAMTTPLALIALGGQLELKSLFEKPGLVLTGSLVKLVIIPLVVLIPAILFFKFSPHEIGALFFIFGSPTAVATFVMAKVMKSDDQLAGLIVMYTTLLSGLTMFIWLFVLKSLMII